MSCLASGLRSMVEDEDNPRANSYGFQKGRVIHVEV